MADGVTTIIINRHYVVTAAAAAAAAGITHRRSCYDTNSTIQKLQ